MHRLIFGVISFAALALVGCAGMSPASYGSGWTELLNGPKGFDENWTRIGEANWRIVDGIAQADAGKKGENSYLCPDLNNITDRNCTEANIFDQRPDPTYATGAITHLSPIKEIPKAGGKWNTFEITAQGPRIVVVLNGVKTAETDKSNALRGNIGLQWAQGVVKFRKVEIKPL